MLLLHLQLWLLSPLALLNMVVKGLREWLDTADVNKSFIADIEGYHAVTFLFLPISVDCGISASQPLWMFEIEFILHPGGMAYN